MNVSKILGKKELLPEAATYEEPELNVGDIIGRVKKDRINVPLLRKAAPGRSDEEILTEAGKLDDYDYDNLEEGIVFDDYGKRAKKHSKSSMEDRLKFREEFMSEYGSVFNRMQDRLAGAL